MLKPIDRYILRAHIAPFMFGFFLVLFLFLLQFIINYIDQLIGKGLDTWVIVQLIGLNLAWMSVLAVPIGVLFSTLMAFGSLSSTHEITIIKASGGSLLRMMAPVVIFGLLLTWLLFWFNDMVLPEANHRAKILLSDIKRKKPTFELESGRYSTALDGFTILPRKVDSISGKLYAVTIYDNRDFQVSNVINADSGVAKFADDFSHITMTLYNGEIHRSLKREVRGYRIANFDKYIINIPTSGFDFVKSGENMISRGDREMSINDMKEIRKDAIIRAKEATKNMDREFEKHFDFLVGNVRIDSGEVAFESRMMRPNTQVNKSDTTRRTALSSAQKRLNFLISSVKSDRSIENQYRQKANQYEVEIHKKYAIPFACLIFVFVGVPLGIKTKGGNFGISAAITLGFYIFYWVCLIGGEKLADRNLLSPMLSMWLGNIINGIIGILLTLKINNESMSLSPIPWIKKILHFR